MHDPRAVRGVEGARDLDRNCQHLVERQRAVAETIGERLAFEILHDEKIGEVLPTDVMERADVRVRELGDRAGFTLETLAELRVSRESLRKDLDGDDAIESRVARFVDLAHAAGPQGGEDLVRAEADAGGQGHA